MLEFYEMRWEIVDLAIGVDRLRLPHSGSPDDDMTWAIVDWRT